jgi:hypothetical protein
VKKQGKIGPRTQFYLNFLCLLRDIREKKDKKHVVFHGKGIIRAVICEIERIIGIFR